MLTIAAIVLGGVLVAALVGIAINRRKAIYAWANEPALGLRKGHVASLFTLALLGPVLAMVVGLIGRVKLNKEIERNKITRAEVRRLAQPEVEDIIRLLRIFYRECAKKTSKGEECRRQYIRTITRIVRVQGAPIVPAPGGSSQPIPRQRAPATRTVIVRPPAPQSPPAPPPARVPTPRPDPRVSDLQRQVASIREQVDLLKQRRALDSKTVDELENIVRVLETAVGGLGRRVDGLLAELCRGPLNRLLGALGSCR